jgi:hypothetical protein
MEGLLIAKIPYMVSLYGKGFTNVSWLGLVIGTFELAFQRTYFQVIFRMLVHLLCIPLGAYLSLLKETIPSTNTVFFESKALLAAGCLSVGSIGLLIAMVELGLVPITKSLINRMGIYALCVFISLPFLPMK